MYDNMLRAEQAATRVYLMEPCVDPAHEVQAAGQIHRLGQVTGVLAKRFVYRETYVTNPPPSSGKQQLTFRHLSRLSRVCVRSLLCKNWVSL